MATAAELQARIAELEDALAEQKVWLRVLDLAGFMTVVFSEGHFSEVNRTWIDRMGYTKEELRAMSYTDLLHPDDLKAALAEEKQAESTEGAEITGTLNRFRTKDGDYVWTQWFVVAFAAGGSTYCLVQDITERKQAEAERARLQQQIIDTQQAALQELSTPIIPVMEGIIVMPLVGSIDTKRARDITRSLLAGISEHRAKVVILDITGVAMVDSGVADHLNKTIQAARLKGARTIITGVSDAVAETVVDLGIDWSDLDTMRDLQTGLLTAVRDLNIALGD
jgi:rsbT co-antagonist protein RsbR